MNLKLDENLDARLTSVLRRAGHEVSMVHEQGRAGVDDQALYVHCRSESRILVPLVLSPPAVACQLPAVLPGRRDAQSPSRQIAKSLILRQGVRFCTTLAVQICVNGRCLV
jgi:hypothetical protein